MDRKLMISKEEAKKISQEAMKKMNTFYKKHYLNNSDPLSVILKTHLYIETCIEQILVLVLPDAKKLLNKGFSHKLDIIEALGWDFLCNMSVVTARIRAFNNLRNSFAHDLDKDLTSSDIGPLIKGFDINYRLSNIEKLKKGLIYVVGYIHFIMTFEECFPFLSSFVRNRVRFKRDKGNITKDKIKAIYPWDEIILALEYFRVLINKI